MALKASANFLYLQLEHLPLEPITTEGLEPATATELLPLATAVFEDDLSRPNNQSAEHACSRQTAVMKSALGTFSPVSYLAYC